MSPDFARRTAAQARSLPQDAGHPQAGKILAFPVRAIAAAAAVVCASLVLFWGPDQTVNTTGTSPTTDPPDQSTEPSMAEPVMAEVEPWEWELEEVNLIDQMVAHNDPANLTDAELEFLLF